MTNDFFQVLTSATSNKWFIAMSNKRISQRVTTDFLQRATSATSKEGILHNKWLSATSNEQILQR